MQKYKLSLFFIVLHASLVILWNIAGIWLLSQERLAPGPTASLTGVLLFAALIVIYLLFYKKGYEKRFIFAVSFGALFGLIAIYGAFTKDPNLWPSEFWRYAGVAVNSFGLIGFVFAMKAFFKKKG